MKCIRDGKVAVIYSPNYGAGWSTWNTSEAPKEFLLHDEKLVELIENEQFGEITEYVTSIYPEVYCSVYDLRVAWLDQGTQFRIEEYDGSESLVIKYSEYWDVA
jgi:hypothetical protein